MTLYIYDNNQSRGPYTDKELQDMVSQDGLAPSTLASVGSDGSWQALNELITIPIADSALPSKTSEKAMLDILTDINNNIEALTSRSANNTESRVIVTDFQMPFSSMVLFIIKWSLAAIPAMLLLAIPCSILLAIILSLGRR